IPLPAGAADVTVGAGRVWITATEPTVLLAFDPGDGEQLASAPIPAPSRALTATDDAVYVCGPMGIQRHDPNSLVMTAHDDRSCDAIAVGDAVWSLDRAAGLARRFDPADLALTATVEVPTNGTAIAVDGDRVVVSGPDLAGSG